MRENRKTKQHGVKVKQNIVVTYESLVHKHTTLKRCKPVSDDPMKTGCGEYKNMRTEFPITIRNRGKGPRRYYGGWCIECQSKRDSHRNRRDQEKRRAKNVAHHPLGNRGKPLLHTGPVGLERTFFCDLPPVPMAAELRAAELQARLR